MANAITKQTLHDGDKNLVVKVQISGDNSGDESTASAIDMSAYNARSDGTPIASLTLMKVLSSLAGFSAQLIWDATANVNMLDLTDGDSSSDFTSIGGLQNNAGTGVTGDILFATSGLASKDGTFILHLKKEY